MRVSLILAGGGSGLRFSKGTEAGSGVRRSGLPTKLFYPLHGKPVFLHAIFALREVREIKETVLVCPAKTIGRVKSILADYGLAGIKVAAGGETRAESVLRGIRHTNPKYPWVMVHDGARPFVSLGSVRKLLKAGRKCGAAILAAPLVGTVKQVNAAKTHVVRTVDRRDLYEAHTPQLMRRSVLLKAYRNCPDVSRMTDEASLAEHLSLPVRVVPEEAWNPKITSRHDYDLAESFLRRSYPQESRTGYGWDTHRLVKGRKLYLGGVKIPSPRGTLGHSDGDALLHAVSDAALGALGLGDIGDWFPDKDPKYRGIQSAKLLKHILAEARKKGWAPIHTDTVVILEKPKLGLYKNKIKKNLARLLELSETSVSVKAKTREGLGPEGEGLAVTCAAVLTMSRRGQ